MVPIKDNYALNVTTKANMQNSVDKFLILFTNPSARAGYDTRSIFKWSLTGFNTEFSFS